MTSQNNLFSNNKHHNWTVVGSKLVRYDVQVCEGLLSVDNAELFRACAPRNGGDTKRCLVVIDELVYAIYGDRIIAYFEHWGIEAHIRLLKGSELNKGIEQTLNVVDGITDAGLLRRSQAVLVIGGGVVMDIAGFASSLFRRGTTYVRVPTTLMGQVDAGVGIKTGINYLKHKNRLGTYFAPNKTLIDPQFLATLEQRHICNGVAEIIKMALIKDAELYRLLRQEVDGFSPRYFASSSLPSSQIMYLAISGMLEELEPNLWEDNLERLVDYGHTFSPVLELRAQPELLHGEAVAVDMAFSLALAAVKNLLRISDAVDAIELIQNSGLPITHPDFNVDMVRAAVDDTVKHRDGLLRMPLTQGIGSGIFVNDLNENEIRQAMGFLETNIHSKAESVA